MNASLISGVGKSARESASVFAAAFDEFDRIAQLKAEQIGKNFSDDLNRSLIAGTGKSARESAAVFEEQFRIDDAVKKKIGELRAAIDPMGEEFSRLGKHMAEYNKMQKDGLITQDQLAEMHVVAGKRLSDFERNLKSGATAGRVMAGEMVNLSYQVNDVVTGLMLGQPVFMIAAQQGGQIFQIFQSSKASVGEFAKEAGRNLLGLVTPARVGFGGIVLAVGAATVSLLKYQGAMNEVQRQLTGMGRASGATARDIDTIALGSSATSGLSVREARELASALAATGKVGVESIGPIVALGRDFASTFGVDAKEATSLLAKAFADPANGAEELNQRLGFLDARTKILIESLVVQGNRTEAVRILTDKIRDSIAAASDVTGLWGRIWNTTGNAISNFFDRVGRGADRLFDGGNGLDEKMASLTVKLLNLQKAQMEAARSPIRGILDSLDGALGFGTISQQIDAVTASIEAMQKKMKSLSLPDETANKQRGMEIDSIVRSMLPAIDATRNLENQTKALNQAFENPAIRQWVSVAGTDLVLALKRAEAAASSMKGFDPVKNQILDMESQIRLLDRHSPADRAREAAATEVRRQQNDPNAGTYEERLRKQGLAALQAAGGQSALDAVERQRIGTLGQIASVSDLVRMRTLDLTEAGRAGVVITEKQRDAIISLAREQALGTYQIKAQSDQVKVQADTIGMSAGAAAAYTVKMNLLNDAIRNHRVLTAEDVVEIERQAEAFGKVTQDAALKQVRFDISFAKSTSILSSDDVQIAQQLRVIYPDVATGLNSIEAEAIRANQAISTISNSMASSMTSGLSSILDGTKSVSAGFADMSKSIINAIQEALIKMYVVAPIMRSLQFGLGSFLSPASLGGGLFAGIHHSGYGPGDAFPVRAFSDAPRFHTGIGPGERAAVIRDDESVLTPGQMRALAPVARHAPQIKNEINIQGGGINPADVEVRQVEDGNGGMRTDVYLDKAIANAMGRSGSNTRRSMAANYGARPIGVRR